MTTRDIDLARVSLKDALDLAALIEEEAHERYLELADQMDKHRTPEAARFFRFMADNEAKHGAELAARRRDLFGDEPRDVRRTMIFDVEAPDYDEARAFMTARQALDIAFRCERKAHTFFVEALPHIQDEQVKALFAELRDEEVHHQDLVQREIVRLPAEVDGDGEAFVDDPTAQ